MRHKCVGEPLTVCMAMRARTRREPAYMHQVQIQAPMGLKRWRLVVTPRVACLKYPGEPLRFPEVK